MSKEILIQVAQGERRVAVLGDGKLDDFYIELDRHQSMLGNIYKGRVESILPSINGAFVNIGQEKNGFLYLTDADNPFLQDIEKIEHEPTTPQKILNMIFPKPAASSEVPPEAGQPPARQQKGNGGGRHAQKEKNELPLKKDQEVLVQVVKDPFGTKGARLTTHISLAGRFVVYMPVDKHSGISKKIDKPEERSRLRDILKSFNFVRTGGFIIRTASMEQGEKEILRDSRFLVNKWQEIRELSKRKEPPALIYEEGSLIWRVIRDLLKDDVEHVTIDSREEFGKMRKFAQNLIGPEVLEKIKYHPGPQGLFDAKNVTRELDKIYEAKVYLKSGAYVVIEPTEGVTVVDVNSGRFKGRGTPEDAAFAVNMEAAPEIARQLRLRDLGGIIVIDFIDMNREDHKRKVLNALRDGLTKDHAKTEVNRISQLGLVEMTRARTGKTIESLEFHSCPYCEGRGKVKIN
ncbi:MAG: Rne/Rng family ribonuclease [Candidatus Omnitrophica bacterium]|nr:Rne/Rng family ribonuclease [Candidatus Omnitrophota bacterium]MDE2008550.1 Rne/Rng family ribonuclease [Candidatus Omnitrophota bacterium]MDE2214016.1 Rne/Rng family ribonuclease [Candidatus Omnitrophota bacterium]MDE2231006.1 Rne/Rng family ribonuclease [Candidatus Omnitrophota bacterium]